MIGINKVTTAEGRIYTLEELAELYLKELKNSSAAHNQFIKMEKGGVVYNELTAIIDEVTNEKAKQLLEKIRDNEGFRHSLIIANPLELEEHKDSTNFEVLNEESAEWKNKGKNNNELLLKKLEDLLAYNVFRKHKNAIWLAKHLNIRSCLYCNAQSTLTVDVQKDEDTGKLYGSQKALFQFDHFFPKSKYPLLSLSFYNLIPSCASCNQGKSAEATSLKEHFHPYYHRLLPIKFQVEPSTAITVVMEGLRSFSALKIQAASYNAYQNPNTPDIQEHLKLFRLKSIYEEYQDLAGEIYAKANIYNDSYRKEILNLFNKASSNTLTPNELNRIIVGNYIDDEDLHKRPLAKFMRDIAEDSGLI